MSIYKFFLILLDAPAILFLNFTPCPHYSSVSVDEEKDRHFRWEHHFRSSFLLLLLLLLLLSRRNETNRTKKGELRFDSIRFDFGDGVSRTLLRKERPCSGRSLNSPPFSLRSLSLHSFSSVLYQNAMIFASSASSLGHYLLSLESSLVGNRDWYQYREKEIMEEKREEILAQTRNLPKS